jgi:hypothetical protein
LVAHIPSFEGFMRAALTSLGCDGPVDVKFRGYDSKRKDLVDDDAADLLRALIWLCEPYPDLTVTMRDAAERCFQKHKNIGALSAKLGAACVLVLGRQSSPESQQALGAAGGAARHLTTKKSVAKAKQAVAERLGETWNTIEYRSVPFYGLDAQSQFSELFGEHTASLRWSPGGLPVVTWTHAPSGSTAKTVPVAVRESYALELGALEERLKELKRTLKDQARRLERLMIEGEVVPAEAWRQHFVEHPLVGRLSRSLIWRLDSSTVACSSGGGGAGLSWTTLDGECPAPSPSAKVSLWHPAGAAPEEARKWEKWILDARIHQPFQQAARAFFHASDGVEASGGVESTRFSGHRIQEGAFAALCRERNWRYQFHRGPFHLEPTRTFATHGLRAVLKITMDDPGDATLMKTGTLRFCRDKSPEGLELSAVPPVVYSEALRDLSLFVEKASVAIVKPG